MFSGVVESKTSKYQFENNIFVKDEDVFDFGNVLVDVHHPER